MTQEERDALQMIQGSLGWKVMENLIQRKIETLSSVMDLEEDGNIANVALAKKKATIILRDFLGDMGLNVFRKETNKTYE